MAAATATSPTVSTPTTGASPWGRSAPWSKKPVASSAPVVSLADIQAQEQLESDRELALRLQREADCQTLSVASAEPVSSEAEAVAPPPPVEPATDPIDEDAALARILQAQFDEEHDQAIARRERNANLPNSKISVSLDLFRSQRGRAAVEGAVCDDEVDEQDMDSDLDEEEQLIYDKGHRCMRDAQGQIITKHNAGVNGRQNRRRMMDFPLSMQTGDLRTSKRDRKEIRIPSKVFNKLQRFSHRTEKQRQRLHEAKEFSTSVMALDNKTRLVLFKLVDSGKLEEMNGCVSTGKESVVFHATARIDPETPETGTQECAIKVFKTTLTEFKERQQFLHGDRRFELRVGKQSARKLVKLWAEKESANLIRMHQAGLRCPRVLFLQKHLLGMTFIGHDARPAPKLKDIAFKSQAHANACFEQVNDAMHTLYNDCGLVHADLSEYNILWHDGEPWIIDVGQAVERAHPRASEFLFRDCLQVARFFDKAGAAPMTAGELFEFVAGVRLPDEEQSEFTRKLRCSKGGQKKHLMQAEDTSDTVVSQSFASLSLETKAMLLEALEQQEQQGDGATGSSSDDSFELVEYDEVEHQGDGGLVHEGAADWCQPPADNHKSEDFEVVPSA